MYRHCVYCTADLGENQVVEHLPIGRRLAFDGAKGRLWVICRRCDRWNLTPLEERWEAIEECERSFERTRLRLSTEQIGFGRLPEGLDLIRIGKPIRPEFAAWRYGDQFGKRRKRFLRRTGLQIAWTPVIYSIYAANPWLIAPAIAIGISVDVWLTSRKGNPAFTRVIANDGRQLDLLAPYVHRLRPGEAGLSLEVRDKQGWEILSGPEAIHALGLLLPKLNASGAKHDQVRAAIRELEDGGGPERFLASAEYRARKLGHGYRPLAGLPSPIRLALEMASHEEAERKALEGDLGLLEQAWRHAEEIAEIADNLLLPDRIGQTIERFRHQREVAKTHKLATGEQIGGASSGANVR